jgi:hypothetical protein
VTLFQRIDHFKEQAQNAAGIVAKRRKVGKSFFNETAAGGGLPGTIRSPHRLR